MALSNMKREPRREITETTLGVIGLLLFAFADMILSRWFDHKVHFSGPDNPYPLLPLLIVPFSLLCGAGLLWVGVYTVHFVGEVACDVLKSLGLDPRPKYRISEGGTKYTRDEYGRVVPYQKS